MTVWRRARKKPVVVEFREVEHKIPVASNLVVNDVWGEEIHTREGVLVGVCGKDYIIRGVDGELYPIKKSIFEKTYEVVE